MSEARGRGIAQIYAEYRTLRAAFAARPEESRDGWAVDAVIELELDATDALESEAVAHPARSTADAIAALAWLCEEAGKDSEFTNLKFIISLAEGAVAVLLRKHQGEKASASSRKRLRELAMMPLITDDKERTHDIAAAASAAATDQDALLRIYAQLREARAEAYDRQANTALSDEDVRIMNEGHFRFEKRAREVKPVTIGDAIAAMRWAHEELCEFQFGADRADPGANLVLTLIEGALSVLGRVAENDQEVDASV